MTDRDPALIPIDDLDAEIVSLASRMTAREYEFLVLVRTFDERSGWLRSGSAGCAEWLHWRCDLSLSAAREKVRVAHALKTLPAISRYFAAGRLSYSKARALTRVADRSNEEDLLAFALSVSAALVEQRCQQLRNCESGSSERARRAYEQRSLSAFRNREAGRMTVTVEVPLEDGELVLNALDKVLTATDVAADASLSYRARQADALVDLCRSTLAGGPGRAEVQTTPVGSSDLYQVVVHVDQEALADRPGQGARSDLPIETVRRLTCDGSLIPMSDGSAGSVSIGRKRRSVPTAMKRLLAARDGHCRFPGCTHDRFVDAHHVQHWAQGGETCLDNLMLLCSHHHRLVHEGGFQIFVDNHGDPCFRRPDGRAVPSCGFRTEDSSDVFENDGSCRAEPGDPSAEGLQWGGTTLPPETSAEGFSSDPAPASPA